MIRNLINDKKWGLWVGWLFAALLIVLVSVCAVNFNFDKGKAYAQEQEEHNDEESYYIKYQDKITKEEKVDRYWNLSTVWVAVNDKFLDTDIELIFNCDVGYSNAYIDAKDWCWNNKCFGCKPNGEQYKDRGNCDHFLLAMPGSGKLTINLNGHKLYKTDDWYGYLFTSTLQIDHRNVNLVSNNDIQSYKDMGCINSVAIFNNNEDANKTLSVKNVCFDGEIIKGSKQMSSGIYCKTLYGLEVDNCYFTNFAYNSPIILGQETKNNIFATNTTVIKNSQFISNIASETSSKKHGGAIYAKGFVANFDIDNCTFNSNSSREDGGAIMLCSADNCYDDYKNGPNTQTNVTNCRFENNQACMSGGAIWNNNVYFVVSDCQFLHNKAKINGGAIEIAPPLNDSRNIPLCGLSFDTTDMSRYVEYQSKNDDGHVPIQYEGENNKKGCCPLLDDGSTNRNGYSRMCWRNCGIKNNETKFIGNEATNGGAVNIVKDRLPLFAGSMIFKDNKAHSRGGAINFDCYEGNTSWIFLQEGTYLYARFNYVNDREENIRLEDNGAWENVKTNIYTNANFNEKSEFGIWTHQRNHRVIDFYSGKVSQNWKQNNLHCDNSDGWFEYLDDEGTIKFWKD